jgi:hypothetical protein
MKAPASESGRYTGWELGQSCPPFSGVKPKMGGVKPPLQKRMILFSDRVPREGVAIKRQLAARTPKGFARLACVG